MKIKLSLIAALLSVSSTYAVAGGDVEVVSMVCGDHYLQVKAVDKLLTAVTVDNVESQGAAIAHTAKNGVAAMEIYGVFDYFTNDGWVAYSDNSGQRMKLVKAKFIDISSLPAKWTAVGKPSNCKEI